MSQDEIDELLGAPGVEAPDRLSRARDRLTEMLASSARDERHELLFKRGVVEEKLGETAAARDDYRAALNQAPGHPVIHANLARLESEGRLPDDS
jgi:Flp pilus assembly protein TadD